MLRGLLQLVLRKSSTRLSKKERRALMQGHARPKMPQTAIGPEMEHNERTYSSEICEKLACLYLWPKLAPDVCLTPLLYKDVSKMCQRSAKFVDLIWG